MGNSPWGCKELDMTEKLRLFTLHTLAERLGVYMRSPVNNIIILIINLGWTKQGTKQGKIIQETEAGEQSCVVVMGGWVGRMVKAVTVCVCVLTCMPRGSDQANGSRNMLQTGGDRTSDNTSPGLVGGNQAFVEGLLKLPLSGGENSMGLYLIS